MNKRFFVAFLTVFLVPAAFGCQFTLYGGHYDDTIKFIHDPNAILQSCFNGNRSGDNFDELVIYQPNSLGNWMSDLDPSYNGGLTPKVIEDGSLDDVIEKMSLPVKRETLIQMLNSIGYMKLTSYHWMTLIKKSFDFCKEKEAIIKFECAGPQLKDNGFERRVREAQGEFLYETGDDLSALKNIRDLRGRKAFLTNRLCALDVEGKPIMAFPEHCGQTHRIDKKALKNIKTGECGKLWNQAASKRFSAWSNGSERAAKEIIFE